MWFLSFIPDSWIQLFIHAVTLVGLALWLASSIFSHIPFIGARAWLFKWLGLAIFIAGVFFEGGYGTEMMWRARAADLNRQIAEIQTKSADASKKIVYKYIERTKIVKEKSHAIQSKIPQYVDKTADANCTIPESAVVLHDAASQNELPDPASGAIKRASDVTLSKLLDTTVLNYGTFYEVKEQLKALQDWVREQKKINP